MSTKRCKVSQKQKRGPSQKKGGMTHSQRLALRAQCINDLEDLLRKKPKSTTKNLYTMLIAKNALYAIFFYTKRIGQCLTARGVGLLRNATTPAAAAQILQNHLHISNERMISSAFMQAAKREIENRTSQRIYGGHFGHCFENQMTSPEDFGSYLRPLIAGMRNASDKWDHATQQFIASGKNPNEANQLRQWSSGISSSTQSARAYDNVLLFCP